MKYRMTKRLLAALLCACLLVTSLPLQALAAVDVTKGNSAQENAQLLQQLEALTGGESEAAAALATMRDLGLVNENGNLLQTRTVTLDGQEMTLDQVCDYLETCKEEDLDKMVEVDGTQVTLENLATMMAIEAEIDRVRETYFSGETPDLTEEQQAALESLANQLETQGITLYNPDALTFPSGVDHGARVSVQVSGTDVTTNTDGSVTVPNSAATLTATFSLAAAAKTDVTFQVRTLDGSTVKGTNYTAVEKTVTIPTGETSATVEISLLKEDNTWTNDNLWSGDKVFYLQANNITGALFAGDTHSLTQAVRIQDTSISADSFLTSVDTYAYDSGSDVNVWTKIPGEYSFEVYHDDEKYFLKHSVTQAKMSWRVPTLGISVGDNRETLMRPDTVYYIDTGVDAESRAATEQYHAIRMNGVIQASSHVGYDLQNAELTDVNDFKAWESKVSGFKFLSGSNKNTSLSGELTWDLPQDLSQRSEIAQTIADGEIEAANWIIAYPAMNHNGFHSYSDLGSISASATMYFYDKLPPEVESVTVDTDSLYTAQDVVPVTATFAEAVKVSGNETLVINDKSCKVQESAGTITRTVTFLYEVQAAESSSLKIGNLSSFTDVSGNSGTAVNLNRTVADVIDTNIPHWAALTNVTTDAENGAYAPGVTTGTLTVTLHEDEDVRSWLTQAGATDPNDKLEGAYAEYSRSTVLGASMDGGKTIIPLYIAPDGGQMVGKLEFPVSTEDDVTHVVEFFELQDGNPITSGEGEDAKPVPFFGIYTSFVAQQAVFLGEGDVTFTTPADWPEDGQRVFGDQLTAPFTLSFTVVDQEATWKDTSKVTIRDSEGKLVDEDAHFLWESSNPQVATINEKGEITILTNGAVSFTLTALNGNVEKAPADPPQEATTYAYTYATPEILVGVGNSPFLTVPEYLRTTTVRGGQPATVLWSSNLTEKNRDNATGEEEPDSVETTFTLTLYNAGQFDESAGGPNEDAQGEALDPVVSSMKDVKSSALIPASKIPYANGQPYYVTISATDNATGKPYTSWAKIEVQSPPAVVELARPSSLYITDEVGTLPLTWSLANFNGDGREFRLVITNNTTSAVQGNDVNAENQSGSFTMNIADVTNGYRDTYTVEVAAKNATDSTWSYDSFVLYVYNRAALQQFVVDGEDRTNGSAITLSNGEKEYIQKLIDSQNSTAAQQAVWDTGRDISLTADVSMDPDKPWLEVPDQFVWSAEDTTAASGTGQTHATLNYQQGALYEDITRYQRTSYGPTAEFRLSGLSDGTTKVTAEHVNTGTVAELIVNVDTLQDKLFLFQFTPAVETTLRYTNGDGVQKEATSMADGRAAIYEENGIQGDVYLESQQGDTEYFGTLYNENLVSSEKDSTQLELYPVNYMTLRKAAQVPIYLKKPDGTPYLGQVTVHGGVYLNDAYAPDARLDTDDGQGYDGKEGYTVNLAQDNGAHTFVFDMTQFSTEGRNVSTEPVDASDNLQFVFQMEAEGYAILAMKIGLFGQLSFQGAVRFLNAIGEAQAKVGYKIDFLGEVGIEFLIKFLFITYERVLWSQKIEIPSIQDNNWTAIEKYWEEVQQGNSGNEYEIITPGETQQASLAASQQPELLAADSSTGVALYGAPSTATLERKASSWAGTASTAPMARRTTTSA